MGAKRVGNLLVIRTRDSFRTNFTEQHRGNSPIQLDASIALASLFGTRDYLGMGSERRMILPSQIASSVVGL